MNNVSITGRCSSDVLKFMTQTGRPIIKFALAFDSRMKHEDGTKETSYIDCEAWDILADRIYETILKGDRLGITGHLYQAKFKRKDGSTGSTIKVVISSVDFIEKKRKTEETEEEPKEEQEEIIKDEDLPF